MCMLKAVCIMNEYLKSHSDIQSSFFVKCLLHFRTLLRLSFQLKIKGYNSKQIVLLRKIVERMVTLELTEDRFNVVKERVCKGTFIRFT